jgi:(E)-4-hydroxy-3-methylbut-2-enyl-diphosphate synthase
MKRKITKSIYVRGLAIGGGNEIPVQSMTNVPAHDFNGTVSQLLRLERSGCDIARIAVPKEEYAEIFTYAKERL